MTALYSADHLSALLTLHRNIRETEVAEFEFLSRCHQSIPQNRLLIDAVTLNHLSGMNHEELCKLHSGVFPFSLCATEIDFIRSMTNSEMLAKENAWKDIILNSEDDGIRPFLFLYLSLWKEVAELHPSIATVFSGLPMSVTTFLAEVCDRLTLQIFLHKYPQTVMLSGTNLRLQKEGRDFVNTALIDHIRNIKGKRSNRMIKSSRFKYVDGLLAANSDFRPAKNTGEKAEDVCQFLSKFGIGYRSVANILSHFGLMTYREACNLALKTAGRRESASQCFSTLNETDKDRLISCVDAGLNRVRRIGGTPSALCCAFPAACIQAADILGMPIEPESVRSLMRSVATQFRKRDVGTGSEGPNCGEGAALSAIDN